MKRVLEIPLKVNMGILAILLFIELRSHFPLLWEEPWPIVVMFCELVIWGVTAWFRQKKHVPFVKRIDYFILGGYSVVMALRMLLS